MTLCESTLFVYGQKKENQLFSRFRLLTKLMMIRETNVSFSINPIKISQLFNCSGSRAIFEKKNIQNKCEYLSN